MIYFVSFYKKQEFLLIPIILISFIILAIDNFTYQLDGISFDRFSDNRNFSILATIPFIHIILFLFNQKKSTKNLFFATIQILIINFLFYSRTSILLEILFVILICSFYLAKKFLFTKNKSLRIFLFEQENYYKFSFILILLFCALILPNFNKLIVGSLYSEYIKDRHQISAMIRAGMFVDNPNLRKKYNFDFHSGQLNIDVAIYKTGKAFYDKIDKNPNKDQIYFPYGGINLEKQGKLERKFIFWLLKNEFSEIMKNIFIYKPKKIIQGYRYEFKIFLERYNFHLIDCYIFLSLLITILISSRNQKVLFLSSIIISTPVILKNIFFWGLTDVYFLDLFLIVSVSLLIFFLIFLRKILEILNGKYLKL